MVSEPKRSKQPELCCGAGWIARHTEKAAAERPKGIRNVKRDWIRPRLF